MKNATESKGTANPPLISTDLLEALAVELRTEQREQDKSATELFRAMSDGKKYSERANLCGLFAGVLERTIKSASNNQTQQKGDE